MGQGTGLSTPGAFPQPPDLLGQDCVRAQGGRKPSPDTEVRTGLSRRDFRNAPRRPCLGNPTKVRHHKRLHHKRLR